MNFLIIFFLYKPMVGSRFGSATLMITKRVQPVTYLYSNIFVFFRIHTFSYSNFNGTFSHLILYTYTHFPTANLHKNVSKKILNPGRCCMTHFSPLFSPPFPFSRSFSLFPSCPRGKECANQQYSPKFQRQFIIYYYKHILYK